MCMERLCTTDASEVSVSDVQLCIMIEVYLRPVAVAH